MGALATPLEWKFSRIFHLQISFMLGYHKVQCVTWKPTGTWRQRLRSYFVGGGPMLRNSDIIYTGPDRYRLTTVAMGTIHLNLSVILRNFDKFGIECG